MGIPHFNKRWLNHKLFIHFLTQSCEEILPAVLTDLKNKCMLWQTIFKLSHFAAITYQVM